MVNYTIYVTDMLGNTAEITGPASAIERIETVLYGGGARFEKRSETWDFGFYATTGDYDEKRGGDVSDDLIEAEIAAHVSRTEC